MKHEIDLKNYDIRTDVIIDYIDKFDSNDIIRSTKEYEDIKVEDIVVSKKGDNIFNSEKGIYKIISFKDITDKDNFKNVEEVLINELKDMYKKLNINDKMSCLIIGLGNKNSTPDSLGPKVIDNILVTNYLFALGEVEEGYRKTFSVSPGVTASTGIETSDFIKAIVDISKPDFMIVIDALASSSTNRVNQTIQITDRGILPGSGVGNSRKEINKEILKIPVIAIGIPTIVDAASIVNDTIEYMKKNFSYEIENINNNSNKFINPLTKNYLKTKRELTDEELKQILGIVGTLTEEDRKKLIIEVLSPINYNLMVTPKEIDFVIEKLSLLLSNGINKTLHSSYTSTN